MANFNKNSLLNSKTVHLCVFLSMRVVTVFALTEANQEQSADEYRQKCAVNACYIATKLIKSHVSYNEINASLTGDTVDGVSLQKIVAYFRGHGISALPCSLDMQEAAKSKYPFVMLISETAALREKRIIDHYVVCWAVHPNRLQVIDAPSAPYEINISQYHLVKHPCLLLNQSSLFLLVIALSSPIAILCLLGICLTVILFYLCSKIRFKASKFIPV